MQKEKRNIQKLRKACLWMVSSHARTLHVDIQCVFEESLLRTVRVCVCLGAEGCRMVQGCVYRQVGLPVWQEGAGTCLLISPLAQIFR